MRSIDIAGRRLGDQDPPLVVAEISANHGGTLERALELIDALADAGVEAVKFQTYTPDTMTIRTDAPGFVIEDPSSLWHGRTLYDLYEEAHTPWEWHAPLFTRANEHGMIAFSTPFDPSSVEFLQGLDCPCFKIASFELTDLPLIRAVAETGKPVIMSTGMALESEIHRAVAEARQSGCTELVLLQCTSAYPAPVQAANLRSIPALARAVQAPVGLSDHTLGIGVAVGAVALGAVLIEKHVCLRRSDGGADSPFSLEVGEFGQLVRECRDAWLALGTAAIGPTSAEQGSLQFRRSLYAVADIEPGEAFTSRNVRAIRPGFGLPPAALAEVLASRATSTIRRGTPLEYRHLEQGPASSR